MKDLFWLAVFAVIAIVVRQAIPDIQRYMRMRDM
jgi:hypothetical protein